MKIKTSIFCGLLFLLSFQVLYAQSDFITDDVDTKRKTKRTLSDDGFIVDELNSSGSKRGKSRTRESQEAGDSFFLGSETGSALTPDDGFITSIEEKWGRYERSSKKVWVQYDKYDQSAQSRLDFERGVLTIETVVEADSREEARSLAQKLIARRLERLVEDDRKTILPVITNNLVNHAGEILSGTKLQGFVNDSDFIIEIIEEPRRRERTRLPKTKRRSGPKKKYKTKSKIRLKPQHLSERAKMVFPIIQKQCKGYRLDESLVLSVIHVESYFNQRAISRTGAVGLMQLMPQYGGVEAYEELYGKKWKPSRKYLFNPANNIKLGCVYLSKLHSEYFKDIQGDFKKRYSSVAGYNWGPGNVRRKILNNRKVFKMGDDEFFKYLHKRAPQETKNYIVRIREKERNYRKALTGNRGLL